MKRGKPTNRQMWLPFAELVPSNKEVLTWKKEKKKKKKICLSLTSAQWNICSELCKQKKQDIWSKIVLEVGTQYVSRT
jgi:hypothetical protein